MTQPADFYQKKQAFLNELKYDLEQINVKADAFARYEHSVADRPDTAAFTKLIERLTKAKMALDLPLGNVERMMNN